MKNKIGILLISLAITVALEAILVILFNSFKDNVQYNAVVRIITMFGGDLPFGIIQAFTFFLFFYGMFEIREQFNVIKNEQKAFNLNLLPEKENWMMSPSDVTSLRLQIVDIEKREKYQLTNLIKSACNKYRSDKSPSDALAVVSAQVKINSSNAESDQSLIRYVGWAIPSVGFIGTVIGIADSLGSVKQNMTEEILKHVTDALMVAFDTTLVALFLSIFLMYFYHSLQEQTEKLHTKMEAYIIENLINRIYNS